MRALPLICMLTLLAGCGPSDAERQARRSSKLEADKARVRQIVQAGPKATVHALDQGTLTVLDIPSASPIDILYDTQRCYVWRDDMGSSITCPHEPKSQLVIDDSN